MLWRRQGCSVLACWPLQSLLPVTAPEQDASPTPATGPWGRAPTLHITPNPTRRTPPRWAPTFLDPKEFPEAKHLQSAVFKTRVLTCRSWCFLQVKVKKRHRNSAPEWGAYCNLGDLGQWRRPLFLLVTVVPVCVSLGPPGLAFRSEVRGQVRCCPDAVYTRTARQTKGESCGRKWRQKERKILWSCSSRNFDHMLKAPPPRDSLHQTFKL